MLNREGPLSSQGKTWPDRDKLDLHFEIVGELGTGGTVVDGAKSFVDRRFAEAEADAAARAAEVGIKSAAIKPPSEKDRKAAVVRAHGNHYKWREEVAAMSDERKIIENGFAAIGMRVDFIRFSDGDLPDPNPYALRVPAQKAGRPKKPRA